MIASFQNFKIRREDVDGELRRGDASDWGRSIDGKRLIVDGDEIDRQLLSSI
jgi:hypothetical protein